MALVAQRFLLVLGGNDGRSTLGDVWALDTASKPYAWKKVEPEGEGPNARMYSAVASRFDGLLLLCGGRDASGASRADAYGLARHRDGRWEWAAAPGVAPAPRYQHTVVFVGHRLVVCGGAAGGGRVVEEAAAVVMDTSAGGWAGQAVAAGDPLALACRRCRHAAASVGSLIFLHGGLRGGTLLEDMVVADDAAGPEHMRARQLAAAVGLEHEAWQAWATDAGLIAYAPLSPAPGLVHAPHSDGLAPPIADSPSGRAARRLAGSDGLSAAARSEAGSVNQRGLRRQDSGSLLYDAEEGAAVARILSHAGSSGSLGVGAAGGGAHEVSMADMSGAGGADGVSLSLNGGYQTPARARTPELGGRHPGPAFRQGGGMAGGPPSSGYRDGFDAGGPGSTPGVRIHHKASFLRQAKKINPSRLARPATLCNRRFSRLRPAPRFSRWWWWNQSPTWCGSCRWTSLITRTAASCFRLTTAAAVQAAARWACLEERARAARACSTRTTARRPSCWTAACR